MKDLLPDFLRGTVYTIMNVVLMITLLQPKYSKKVTRFALLGIIIADITLSLYCYLQKDLTLLSKLDLILFALICFAIKPLFKDSFLQWLFCYITIQNFGVAVIVLSFLGSRHLPYPKYANTVLRLILFLVIVFLLRRYVRPLYRQMVERWNDFFYVAAAINASFNYYFWSSKDIISTLREEAVPLVLLVFVTLAAYSSIFYSLKALSREYTLREENLKMQNGQTLLRLSTMSMEQRLSLMDQAARQMSILNHDRRHFNNTLLGLLRQEKNAAAITMLEQQAYVSPATTKSWCENPVVNAAVTYYLGLADKAGIDCDIKLDIPATLPVDSLELTITLSNLLENAIHACEELQPGGKRYIRCTGLFTGQLIIEIENSCTGEIPLDEKGNPLSLNDGHGIGTKSVLAFADHYNGQVIYNTRDGVFNVRLLL